MWGRKITGRGSINLLTDCTPIPPLRLRYTFPDRT